MNHRYHHHNHVILQNSFFFYSYSHAVSAPRFVYNQVTRNQSVEYVDEVAILNTTSTRSRVNQQPMHHHHHSRSRVNVNQQPMHYSLHPTPENTPLHPSFVRRRTLEDFLEESLIMHEIETNLARERETGGGISGSGLSKEKISERLRVYTNITEGEEGDTCCICLGEYGEKEEMGVLECGHQYHAECIKRWLLSKNVCPMCRSTALTV